MIDDKQLTSTAIDSAGKIDGSTKFPLKLASAAYNTATSSGEEQQDAALSGARSIVKKAAGPAGDAVGAALGLANVLSKPEGSVERSQAAQKELKSAAGIIPIAGPLAADALIDKINKEFGPGGEAKVSEGDGFDVKGSLNPELQPNGDIKVGDQTVPSQHDPAAGNVNDVQVAGELGGDNKRILPDGSIDQGNGQVVTPDGEIRGARTEVTEGDGFTVKGELNGDNATDSGGTIVTDNPQGQLVTPDGELVGGATAGGGESQGGGEPGGGASQGGGEAQSQEPAGE